MGVAGLEQGAGGGAGLLDRCLNEVVEELGEEEAGGEEDGLEVPPKKDVGDEAAEGDEDGDEGHPGQEVAQLVAGLVPDVGQRHRLEARRC